MDENLYPFDSTISVSNRAENVGKINFHSSIRYSTTNFQLTTTEFSLQLNKNDRPYPAMHAFNYNIIY